MLDIKFIRENKEIVQAGAKKKHVDIDIERLVTLDDERLKLQKEVEDLRAEVNRVSNDISRDQDPALKIQLIEEMRLVKDDIKGKEEKLKTIMEEWQKLMIHVPNVPDMTVPEGESDEQNVEIRTWGEKPVFTFQPKDHVALMENLDMVDFDRGIKVSGFRGYFMKNDGATLFFALWQYFLNYFIQQGYTPMIVPSLVRKESLIGTGMLPQSEVDLSKLPRK
jgi:seryl-tRNA synthetase